MKEKPIYLSLAVFDGASSAQVALAKLPKLDPSALSVVVVEKDASGQLDLQDVGLTPGKGANWQVFDHHEQVNVGVVIGRPSSNAAKECHADQPLVELFCK